MRPEDFRPISLFAPHFSIRNTKTKKGNCGEAPEVE